MESYNLYEVFQENGEFVVEDVKTKYRLDLRKRLFQFAVFVIKKRGKLIIFIE
jgi:hypothetical protein